MGNCLQGCMNTLNDLKDRKVVCPKCKKHRWNKRKPKNVFLKEGCIMCTMREKYKFKPLDLNTPKKSKVTGRYYSDSEVTIENVEVFVVDDKRYSTNVKMTHNRYHGF